MTHVTEESGEDQETVQQTNASRPSTPLISLKTSSSHHCQVTVNNPDKHITPRPNQSQGTGDLMNLKLRKFSKNVSETLVGASQDADQMFGEQAVTEMKLTKIQRLRCDFVVTSL